MTKTPLKYKGALILAEQVKANEMSLLKNLQGKVKSEWNEHLNNSFP